MVCLSGYVLVNDTNCFDIDECATNTHECGTGETCQNHEGSYACECSTGYKVGPDKKCVDVDECKNNGSICGQNGRCENTVGSYRCACDAGFVNVEEDHGPGVCEEKGECQKSPELCEHDCINTRGSYRCACKPGFLLNSDNTSCTDIDECKEKNFCGESCVNLPGSFTCNCSTGYKLDSDKKICQGTNIKGKKSCKKSKNN